MRKIKYLVLVAIMIGGNLEVNFSSAALANCDDLKFVFARGSGEELDDKSAEEWQKQLESQLSTKRTLKYEFYELGSQAQDGKYGVAKYPAVAVAGSAGGVANLVGAAVSGGEAFEFGQSVDAGMRELKNYISNVAAKCPKTKFVLGGYSQGAMVVSQSLPELDSGKIIYAATFGDPKLYLPEGEGISPPACTGHNLSEYRRDVVDCRAFEGILGSQRPYQPQGFGGKVGIWCNKQDLMCSSHWSLEDHTSYVEDGMYAAAAEYIAILLQREFPGLTVIDWQKSSSTKNNVVFLVDSTGSMMNLMDKYRNEAKRLAETTLRTGGRIALFEFRDLDDPFPTKMHCDLSCDYATFVQKLDNIQSENEAGGDSEESTLSAMLYAMDKVNWQDGANKSMVVVTDGGYLEPDRDGTTLEKVVRRSLEIDPVNAYFVTSSSNKPLYQKLAGMTVGRVFSPGSQLTDITDAIVNRPVVKLAKMKYAVPTGTTVKFDASESYTWIEGQTSQHGLLFDWDLNGDGNFEYRNAGTTIEQTYTDEFDGFIQVRVIDKQNRQSTMSAKVVVGDGAVGAPATIHTISAKPIVAGATQVKFTTDAKRVLISVNDAILGYTEIKDVSAPQTLDLSGLQHEADSQLELTLIPYDRNGNRGTRNSLILEFNGASSDNKPSDDSDNSSRPGGAADSGDESDSQAETQTTGVPSIVEDNKKRKIPLAPRAGVGPKH